MPAVPKRTFSAIMAATVVLAVGLPIGPIGSTPAQSASATRGIPDVTTLFRRAVTIVRATQRPRFAKAVVLEADGITRGGGCNLQGCFGGRGVSSAAGVIAWRFVFNNQATRQKIRSATIYYGPAPKQFGRLTGYTAPFLDDVDIPKAPRMTLTQAVALVRRAGHRGKFFDVTLRNPLGTKRLNPMYIFGFAGAFVGVDTVTKKVRPLSTSVGSPGHAKP